MGARNSQHDPIQYKGELPSVQLIAQAISHLQTTRQLTMIEHAALNSGGWSRQLRELYALVCVKGSPQQ